MNKAIKNNFIGIGKISKGVVAGQKVVALDFIGECPGRECKLFRDCNYLKVGPCRLRKLFLYHIINSYVTQITDLKPIQLTKIGALLLPLWDQLVRFKMEEATLSEITTKGGLINPIYSAIRETIKTILRVEAECVHTKGAIEIPSGVEELNQYGDPNFYSELTQDLAEPPEDAEMPLEAMEAPEETADSEFTTEDLDGI